MKKEELINDSIFFKVPIYKEIKLKKSLVDFFFKVRVPLFQ